MSPDLRRLERAAANASELDPDESVELYPLLVEAREALARLAETIENVAG